MSAETLQSPTVLNAGSPVAGAELSMKFTGTGLHSGAKTSLTVIPGFSGGLRFERIDLQGMDNSIAVRPESLGPTILSTELQNVSGVSVSTTEHLLSVLAAYNIWNAVISVDGPEIPIMDGSALDFSRNAERLWHPGAFPCGRRIRILRDIGFSDGVSMARLEPTSDDHLEIDAAIDFPDAAIGRQQMVFRLGVDDFATEISGARTFCRLSDIEEMRSRGRALGGTLDNAIVVEGAAVLNPGGLRWRDEFIRHKILDIIGDLAVLGRPVLGRYRGSRAGHGTTAGLVRALLQSPEAWILD